MANSERLFVLDHTWRTVGDFTDPWMGGNHDILAEEEGIWVTCTTSDLLSQFGWDGRVRQSWEWRCDAGLKKAFGLPDIPPVDRNLDFRDPGVMQGGVQDTVHLNAVTRAKSAGGDLLLSFGRIMPAAVYRRQRLRSRPSRPGLPVPFPQRPRVDLEPDRHHPRPRRRPDLPTLRQRRPLTGISRTSCPWRKTSWISCASISVGERPASRRLCGSRALSSK